VNGMDGDDRRRNDARPPRRPRTARRDRDEQHGRHAENAIDGNADRAVATEERRPGGDDRRPTRRLVEWDTGRTNPRLFAEYQPTESPEVARRFGVPRLVEVHRVMRRHEGEAQHAGGDQNRQQRDATEADSSTRLPPSVQTWQHQIAGAPGTARERRGDERFNEEQHRCGG